MFGGVLGDLLPLAVGIAISPIPIIACILVLFSPNARVNGPAFLVGWVAGVAILAAVITFLSDSAGATADSGGGPTLGDAVVLVFGVLLILLAVRQWRGRPKPGETVAMPAWMSAIDTFTPVRALGLGALLATANPKNLTLSAAAGLQIDAAVAAGGSAAALIAVFTIIGSLTIVVPVIYVLVGGEGAMRTLDGWRTWLVAHNAAVMTVLFTVIGAKLLGTGLDAFLG